MQVEVSEMLRSEAERKGVFLSNPESQNEVGIEAHVRLV